MTWTRALLHWLVAAGLAVAFFASGPAREARRTRSASPPSPPTEEGERDRRGRIAPPAPDGSKAGAGAPPGDGAGVVDTAGTDLPSPPATWIRISRGALAVAWRRGSAGAWTVESPAGAAIPPGLLAAFAEQLDVVREGERIDAAGPDSDFGLEGPSLRIEWTGAGGGRADLRVGNRTPAGTAWYARNSGAGADGAVRIVGANLVYYADLVLGAAR